MERFVYQSPVGPLTFYGEGDTLYRITFGDEGSTGCLPIFDRTIKELSEYFCGERKTFTIPLLPAKTPFSEAVRQGMLDIPYGETLSYGCLAEKIGKSKASRAVGGACHNNPYPIIVPCHRVVGKEGVGGFAADLSIKEKLLELEKSRDLSSWRI